MSFNEEQFRRLVDETEKTIIALGTTAQAVLDRHRRFTEQLAGFLHEKDCGFDLQLCLDYVNTLEHDPASKLSSSYVDWIAFHRFVHLLAEQEQGTLTSWKHYPTEKPPELQSSEFNDALRKYAEYESSELWLKEDTVKGRVSWVRKMFLYFESHYNPSRTGFQISPHHFIFTFLSFSMTIHKCRLIASVSKHGTKCFCIYFISFSVATEKPSLEILPRIS